MPAFGQSLPSELPQKQLSDSSNFWYKFTKKREQQLGLKPIETSTYPFHFRLTITSGTILDVWQQENQFQGSLTLWVKQSDDALGTFERIYSQQYTLSTDQTTSIGRLVKECGIINLPSDEHIKGWQQGLDGEEIVTQYVDNKGYWLREYWTPSAQHGLAEALLVQEFANKAFELANVPLVRKNFTAGIPFNCYTNDGSFTICKILSRAEYWQYRRELSHYLRQHKKNNP